MLVLNAGNRYAHAAVRSVASGAPLPEPPAGSDWAARASEQGVLPVLVAHAGPAVQAEHRHVLLARAAHHLRTMADLRVVAEAFAGAGLDWLVFKGPVLSEVVHQRPGARSYGDLDVLVRPAELEVATAALFAKGAEPLSPGWAEKKADGLGEMVLSLPYGTFLDLHWHMVNNAAMRAGFLLDTDELLNSVRMVDIDGIRLPTLDAVDTVLHVALHACKSGGDQLRWLLDLHQSLLRLDVPVVALLERSRQLGLELVLRSMVNRVRRFVDKDLPDLGRPGAAEAMWLALDAFGTWLWPPGSRGEGRFSAAVLARSVRVDAKRSFIALSGNAPEVLRGRSGRRLRARAAAVDRTRTPVS